MAKTEEILRDPATVQPVQRPPQVVPSSYFYTPALRMESLEAHLDRFIADALVIDLEDSIHTVAKAEARALVARHDFTAIRGLGVPVGLRVNPIRSRDGLRDLDMLYDRMARSGDAPFDFVLLPKVRHRSEVEVYRAHFDQMAKAPQAYSFIETTDAVADADGIASLSDGLCYGQADLVAELYAPNAAYLAEAQARMCVAAAKYRIPAVDTNSFEINDMKVVEAQSRASLAAGFTGKAAIHPRHVAVINKVFDMHPETLRGYRATVTDYAEQDSGFRIVGDRVVAPPFVAKARLMLDVHGRTCAPLVPGGRRAGPR